MRGQIRKRGMKWVAIIYLGRDPKTGKKQYKWFTHSTRREAEAHLTHLTTQVQAGAGVPPSRLRVHEFLEQWLKDYAAGAVSPVTLRNYTDTIRIHLGPALGHFPLARLTAQAIQGYLSSKFAHGLSQSSVLYHYRILHEALRHAVRWGLLLRNPAELVDPPRLSRSEMRTWDEEQIRLFLAEARRSSRYYCLYLTAILTGMRQGELLGLRWQDIDPSLGAARVQQTFYRLGRQPLFKSTKTARSRRPVALPPALVDELRFLKDAQDARRRLLGMAYEDHDLVFCQENGKPLHARNFSRGDFRRTAQRVGLPRIRFHDLRHTHATQLLRQGTHPKVVQERLGHSTPAFTLAVYSHVLPGMQDEAARRLEASLLGTGNSKELQDGTSDAESARANPSNTWSPRPDSNR